MVKVKENGKAKNGTSGLLAEEMDTERVEEDTEIKDEVDHKEEMSEHQFEEEEQDEDEADDQSTNEQLQPNLKLGTSDVGTNATDNGANKVQELHEDDDKPEDSENNDVEMASNSPEPDKFVDIAGKVGETICTKNEQGSIGLCDEEYIDTDFKGVRASNNGCTSGSNTGKDANCDESSAMDDKNLTGVLKDEGKVKEVAVVADDVEKISNVSMAMESTEQKNMFMFDDASEGGESGTEEEQLAFMKELESYFRGKGMDIKAPKFYGEQLNLLKLWRAVIKLGGYDKVTACKLWRQVGESFNPPKTCTTVSWTFRIFYEKALLEFERQKISGGELHIPPTVAEPLMSMESPVVTSQTPGSGRARRDAAARAMQGWHSQRLLGNGEVGDPIIKDKSPISLKGREKQLKSIGGQKRKKPPSEAVMKASRNKLIQGSTDTAVIDVGPPADWVKINVRTTKDCYEVYALVPGLLREEVRVQSDPVGRLVISGEPEILDNPWGVTPFKKVVSLPSRIDPHQTSAVVTLHGQLFVRVPFEQSD